MSGYCPILTRLMVGARFMLAESFGMRFTLRGPAREVEVVGVFVDPIIVCVQEIHPRDPTRKGERWRHNVLPEDLL